MTRTISPDIVNGLKVRKKRVHTRRAVSCAATGRSSSWKCSTIVSMLLFRMSRSVSSDSFNRSAS